MKLVIEKGTAKNKKWKAIFYDDKGKKIKTSDGFKYLFNTLKYRFIN